MLKPETIKEWNKILEVANYPPVRLITVTDMVGLGGKRLSSGEDGSCIIDRRVICTKQNSDVETLRNTLWHELLHCMFPYNPEWWIECCAYKLSGDKSDGYGFYAEQYKRTPRYDVPSKRQLLDLIRSASYIMHFDDHNID